MGLGRFCAAVCGVGLWGLTSCGQDASSGAGSAAAVAPTSDEATTSSSTPSANGDPTLAGRLLFSRFDESTHTFVSTHLARPDGTDEAEIPMPGDEGGGRWSRAGDHIAVTTVMADGRIGSAILDPDGTVVRVLDLPDARLNLACTVWSPDDKRLACEGWDEGNASRAGIYTVRSSDGGGLVRLTRTPSELADLVGDYSPDGSTFLFKRTTNEDPGPLMVVPTVGGRATRLADLDVEDPGRYSPDGTSIVTSVNGHIEILDATGRETGQIAEDGTFLFGPVWSPTGDHLAYSGTTSGFHADLYTSRPDGTDRRRVTATPDNEIRVEWGTD